MEQFACVMHLNDREPPADASDPVLSPKSQPPKFFAASTAAAFPSSPLGKVRLGSVLNLSSSLGRVLLWP